MSSIAKYLIKPLLLLTGWLCLRMAVESVLFGLIESLLLTSENVFELILYYSVWVAFNKVILIEWLSVVLAAVVAFVVSRTWRVTVRDILYIYTGMVIASTLLLLLLVQPSISPMMLMSLTVASCVVLVLVVRPST